MKRMTLLLAALGLSGAALANEPEDLTQMTEQSYDRIASGEALPSGESAYGYSMSDPYTDAYDSSDAYILVLEENILVPEDMIVLVPMEQESSSDTPG